MLTRRPSSRRTVTRAGIALLFTAFAAVATACIFEKGGNYLGGGRQNHGADLGGTAPSATSTDETDNGLPNATRDGGANDAATATDTGTGADTGPSTGAGTGQGGLPGTGGQADAG